MAERKAIRLGSVVRTNVSTYSEKEGWAFVNYLDTGNITQDTISEIQRINVGTDKLPSRARRKVQIGNIIYSTVRPNQLHYGFIKSQPDNFLVSTGFAVIDVNEKEAVPEYIYYFLTHRDVTERLQAIAEQSTSAYPSIKPSDIEDLTIDLPPIEEQRKIVGLLKMLDGKIKQNTEINNNLQEQARALYRSWFVDFEPFDGSKPSNWKNGRLKDVLSLQRSSIKAGENTSLPYLPIDIIPMNTFGLSDVKPNEEAQSSLITFSKDDIVIGAMRVYFHRVIIAPFDGITRTTCFTLRPFNADYLGFSLLCCDQDSSIEYAQQTSKGSTMPYAVWDGGLGDMEIPIPDPKTAHRFNEIVMPMIRIIQSSFAENKNLRELRDSLLPRLMSGELDVSDLDL